MALPVVIAKNTTGGAIFLSRLGVSVPASPGQVTLTGAVDAPATFFECCTDDSLITAVTSGDIVVNDGTSDLSAAEGLAYLDASGNMNGPVTGSAVGRLVRLLDGTGRYTDVAPIKWYDSAAVDPTSPTPEDGDLYYNTSLKMPMFYDAGRGKWLSVTETVIQWTRSGNTAPGSYFKIDGDLTFSATNGFYAESNGTIVSMAYTRDDTDSATFEVHADGVLVTGAAIVSTAVKGSDVTVNADFTSGDVLAVFNKATGGTVTNCAGRFRIRWKV